MATYREKYHEPMAYPVFTFAGGGKWTEHTVLDSQKKDWYEREIMQAMFEAFETGGSWTVEMDVRTYPPQMLADIRRESGIPEDVPVRVFATMEVYQDRGLRGVRTKHFLVLDDTEGKQQ